MGNSSKHKDDSKEPATGTVLSFSNFGSVFLDMAWRVAIATLGLSLAGIGLDKLLGTSPWFSIIGVVLAVVVANMIAFRIAKSLGGRKK